MTHFLVDVFPMWAMGTKEEGVRRGRRRKERVGKKKDMREERRCGREREDSEALPGLRYFTYIIAVSLTTPVRGGLCNYMHLEKRRRQWQPTPVLLPEKSMDGGAWWAAIHGVVKSRT